MRREKKNVQMCQLKCNKHFEHKTQETSLFIKHESEVKNIKSNVECNGIENTLNKHTLA